MSGGQASRARRAARREQQRRDENYNSSPTSKRTIKRSKGRGLSGAQRSGWSASPYYRTAVTIDARWSA